jgi:hypothetical protein
VEKVSIGKKAGFLAVLAVLAVISAVGIVLGERTSPGKVDGGETEGLVISADSGFYQQDVEVSVAAPAGSRVYYTVNCEMPDSAQGQLYEEPILLRAEDEEQVYILRFAAVYDDGTESEVYTRSYFLGSNIADRYDTLVLSIVGEPEDLFGYEDGILVPGARYDEFMEENPDAHPGGGVEANYTLRGAEAEREVELMLFDASGEEIFSQTGGVRVAGELSRLNNHKSLRLYARREYDEQNKFVYDFFGDLYSLEDGTLGQEYKRLLLKNSGQDYGYGFVRSELIGRLADQAGFPDTQHVRPVCVYINGDYYGCYWLSSNYDEQYFENRYGEYDGSFVVLEGGDRQKTASDEADEEEVRRVAEFNASYDAFSQEDLTVEENYESLREFLDVENYLQYFAIENYVGNDDWPDANVKTYRYEAGESGYGEDVFDGRYRMLLFDTDYGFGLLFYHETIGCLVNAMTLDKIMYERSPLFAALMQREDCRAYFTSYTLDLMNGAMSAENVAEQLDALHSSRVNELTRTVETDGLVGGLLLEDEVNMETVERNIQSIKNYASARPDYVLQDIQEKFDYHQQYQLTVVSDSEFSTVKINTVYSDGDTFTGTYLKEIPVTLTPCLGPNEVFSYWLVDGVVRTSEELVLQGDDISRDNISLDEIEVHLVTAEVSEPQLRIRAVAAKGDEDYVELVNLSSQSISTGKYYLSDSEDKYQYSLPVVVLKPGETIRLVGKNNYSAESLGQFSLNFNLKEGENLTLTYLKEEVDSVVIPDLSADGVYVKDFQKGVYVEKKYVEEKQE